MPVIFFGFVLFLVFMDIRINDSTLQFLRDISVNNNREWFSANKEAYDVALANMKEFVTAVGNALGETDHLESSKLFRIYRDVRFSKDKSPYKNNFGSGFRRATKRLRGGYYLHLEPGASFAGGGFWAPNAADLKRIRDEFAADPESIQKIMAEPAFIDYFGTIQGDELKTAPKGFDKEDPAIDLIRKKSFVVRRPFTDEEVLSPDFLNEVKRTFEAMRPYFDYMSLVLTMDSNGVSLFE